MCQDETKEEVYSKPQTYAETLKMSEPAKVFVLSLTKVYTLLSSSGNFNLNYFQA